MTPPAVAVFAGDMDVTALDQRHQNAAMDAVEGLLRCLDGGLQIIVQVRRIHARHATGRPVPESGETAAVILDRAMDDHWRAELERVPAYSRSIALIPLGAPGHRATVERAAATIADAVRAAGAGARTVTGPELEEWVSHTFAAPADAPWREWSTHARIGDTWVRGHQLRRLPGVPVGPGWLAPVMGVRAECDIALHLLPASAAEAVSSLGRRLRGLRAQHLLELDRGGVGDPWNDVAIDSASALRDRLARNTGRPVRLSVCAVARGTDPEMLQRATRELHGALSATLSRIEVTHFRHLDAALTAAPAGMDRLAGHKLVDSRAAATCMPWTAAVLDDPGGYRIGTLRSTGAPARLDLFDSSRHANANVAILASSGHGKSFAIGTLVLEGVAHGVPAVLIDPEEEYRSLIAAVGGEYLRLAPGSGSSLNVFELVGAGAEARDAETAQIVVDLIQVLCGAGCGELERARVDAAAHQAMTVARESGRIPILHDCIAPLEATAPAIATVLRRLCTGPLGELFSRPTSLRLDTGVAGISFRRLSPEFVPAATLLVAQWLWCLVGRGRERRHIVFDEVGILAVHPPLRTLLVQLARRCRKYGASLVVATQNAQDLLRSDEGTVVATNCSVLLLGGHRAADATRMEVAFGLTEAQRRFLEGAGRGDFLLIAGSRRAEVRIQVPPLHLRLLTGAG